MSSSDKENEYPWVSYKRAASYLKEAERLNAAPTARIPKGFMSQYAKYKRKNRMKNKCCGVSKKYTWGMRRHKYITNTLKLYNAPYGKTRKRWLGMMMWAYDAGRMPAQ